MGGTIPTNQNIEKLPIIGIDETVHDCPDEEPETDDMPDRCEVLCDDDLIGHRGYIAYEDCLKSLATFMTLPVDRCLHWNAQTSKECRALPPFDIKVNRRGTAYIIEWVSC